MQRFTYVIIDFDKKNVISLGMGSYKPGTNREEVTEWIRENVPNAKVYSYVWADIYFDEDE
jgi:hypothetical protein